MSDLPSKTQVKLILDLLKKKNKLAKKMNRGSMYSLRQVEVVDEETESVTVMWAWGIT